MKFVLACTFLVHCCFCCFSIHPILSILWDFGIKNCHKVQLSLDPLGLWTKIVTKHTHTHTHTHSLNLNPNIVEYNSFDFGLKLLQHTLSLSLSL